MNAVQCSMAIKGSVLYRTFNLVVERERVMRIAYVLKLTVSIGKAIFFRKSIPFPFDKEHKVNDCVGVLQLC